MKMRVQVFTYRDGLLARLAHDLRLTAGAFELRVESGTVRGWFDPAALRVDGVARGERVDAQALSDEDKRKIHANLTREVLETTRYPRIELEGHFVRDGGELAVTGRLTLHGRTREFRAPLRVEGDSTTADVELVPSEFGISPYKALGGAIRLQDRVRVHVELVAERDRLDAAAASVQPVVLEPA